MPYCVHVAVLTNKPRVPKDFAVSGTRRCDPPWIEVVEPPHPTPENRPHHEDGGERPRRPSLPMDGSQKNGWGPPKTAGRRT